MNGKTDAGARVYLDTNVFIEAVEGRGELADMVVELMVQEHNLPRQRLVTSELTLAELLVKPMELGRDDLSHVYDSWTISNSYIEVVPVAREVLKDAARLRARDKTLKLPDAIHLTTARGAGCRYFLTKDARIKAEPGSISCS